MAVIALLPPAIDRVIVPAMFSPSRLCMAANCRLRAVLESQGEKVPHLPSHPAAARGSVFHELLERAARNVIPKDGSYRDAVELDLSRLLQAASDRLAADPETAHFAELEGAFSAADWYNAREQVVRTAVRLLEDDKAVSVTSVGQHSWGRLRFDQLPPVGRWAEVWIESTRLRIAGRVDMLERHSGHRVTLRDYKTGQVHGWDGRVKPHIELQLRLYALASLENDPAASVELFVSKGVDEGVELDEGSIRATEEWLMSVLRGLPAGAELPAQELANPGPHCSHCPLRHVCGAYLDTAPGLWINGTEGAGMPLDTWGEVLSIQASADGGVTVQLMDAAARRAQVVRLADRHAALCNAAVGDDLWMFGLSANLPRPVRGRWVHPRNFYELPGSPPERRAWSLTLFRGNTPLCND